LLPGLWLELRQPAREVTYARRRRNRIRGL